MRMAGIDVHKKVLMVVVIETTRPEEKPERQRFTTLRGDLSRLSSWLRAQDVQEAVMESTAQYWRSVWLELEPHMLLHWPMPSPTVRRGDANMTFGMPNGWCDGCSRMS